MVRAGPLSTSVNPPLELAVFTNAIRCVLKRSSRAA
jgi:hypothetical protein